VILCFILQGVLGSVILENFFISDGNSERHAFSCEVTISSYSFCSSRTVVAEDFRLDAWVRGIIFESVAFFSDLIIAKFFLRLFF
jgi:hypothetical protein